MSIYPTVTIFFMGNFKIYLFFSTELTFLNIIDKNSIDMNIHFEWFFICNVLNGSNMYILYILLVKNITLEHAHHFCWRRWIM